MSYHVVNFELNILIWFNVKMQNTIFYTLAREFDNF